MRWRRSRERAREQPFRIGPTREVSERECSECGRAFTFVEGFVEREDTAVAIYLAACHHHDDVREAWIDVILGTFGIRDSADHVTFGVRVGPVVNYDGPAA